MKYLVIFLVLIGINVQAQKEAPADTTRPISLDGEGLNLIDYLPPLSILIDSAIANSPHIDLLEFRQQSSEYGVQALKRDWTELVSVGANYRYSQFDRLVFGDEGEVIPRVARGYQVSAGVRLPLSYFVGRKDEIRSAEINVKTAETQKKIQEMAIREEVIDTYNNLLLLQKMIVLTTDAKESADLIFQMAEDRFRDGDLSVEELARSTSMKATYSSQYETFKAEFSSTYARLERLVGMPLAKLQNIQE